MSKKTPAGPPSPAPEPTFEEAFARLEEIVAQFEAGELPLEASMTLFEEGTRLARLCQARLDQAQARMTRLLAGSESDPDSGPLAGPGG